jgi:hypothetical protein
LFAGVAEQQLATMSSGSGDLYINANNAFLGRANYSFADKYLLEALFRYDGLSKSRKATSGGSFRPYPADGTFRRKVSSKIRDCPLSSS